MILGVQRKGSFHRGHFHYYLAFARDNTTQSQCLVSVPSPHYAGSSTIDHNSQATTTGEGEGGVGIDRRGRRR